MDIITHNGTFLTLLLFGALFVGVHAFSLYGKVRQEDIDDDLIWMGGKVQLIRFVGRKSYATGFLCYLTLMELLFLVLSSSSVILEMALSVMGNSHSVGALATGRSEINPWAPVLASSTVIAITEVKPFSQIEHAMRRAAHDIAGIPQRLKNTIESIYSELDQDAPPASELDDESDTEQARLIGAAHAAGVDAEERRRLQRLRLDIQTLDGWTRHLIGSLHLQHSALLETRERARAELELFHAKWHELTDLPPEVRRSPHAVTSRSHWSDLFHRALESRRQLAFYLALLLVNADTASLARHGGTRSGDSSSTAQESGNERLRSFVARVSDRRSSAAFDTVVLSTLSGFAAAFGAASLYYLTIYVATDFSAEHIWRDETGEVLIRAMDLPRYLLVTADKVLVSALWDIGGFALIFFVSAAIASGMRASREDRGTWEKWQNGHKPAVQYLTTGVLAVLMTFLVFLVFLFVKLVLYPSMYVDDVPRVVGLVNDLGSSYLGYSLISLTGFPCAVAVCRFHDDDLSVGGGNRDATRSLKTLFVIGCALACGALNLFVLLQMNALTGVGDVVGAIVFPAAVVAIFLIACARYTSASSRARQEDERAERAGQAARARAERRAAAALEATRAERERRARRRREGQTTGSGQEYSALLSVMLALAVPVSVLLASPSALGASGEEDAVPSGCERVGDGGSPEARDTASGPCSIVVGLRRDALPFSYRKSTPPREEIFPGFGGYMIYVCRSVLRELTSHGPFRGARVEFKVLRAKDRFRSLQDGSIDMLCGPDSITAARLRDFYVSHPVFLSGMTYGYVSPASEKFPKSAYCNNIVGVVRGTTAELMGLKALDQSNLLLRFDDALELERGRNDDRLALGRETLVYAMKKSECFDSEWLATYLESTPDRASLERTVEQAPRLKDTKKGYIWQLNADEYRHVNRTLAAEIVTEECPAGFVGMPVKRFLDHDEGIGQFCDGSVLYYLGDFDIINRKIREFSGCDVVMNRFTSSRELYGVFFARGEATPVDAQVRTECLAPEEGGESAPSRVRPRRALLHAEFNNALSRQLQGEVGLLEKAFAREFGGRPKSEDLISFFDSLKIAEPD